MVGGAGEDFPRSVWALLESADEVAGIVAVEALIADSLNDRGLQVRRVVQLFEEACVFLGEMAVGWGDRAGHDCGAELFGKGEQVEEVTDGALGEGEASRDFASGGAERGLDVVNGFGFFE